MKVKFDVNSKRLFLLVDEMGQNVGELPSVLFYHNSMEKLAISIAEDCREIARQVGLNINHCHFVYKVHKPFALNLILKTLFSPSKHLHLSSS